jgi:hypothetical protein
MPSSGASWRTRERIRAAPLDKQEPRTPSIRSSQNFNKAKFADPPIAPVRGLNLGGPFIGFLCTTLLDAHRFVHKRGPPLYHGPEIANMDNFGAFVVYR